MNVTPEPGADDDRTAAEMDWMRGLSAVEPILRSDAVWAGVPEGLEQRVLNQLLPDVVVAPEPVGRSSLRRRVLRRSMLTLAAGVLVAAGFGVVALGPDAQEVALTATALGGDTVRASAEVRETASGAEITIKTKGLAPAPSGRYYQGWLVGPAGSVTIGTFHLRDGADDVVLWSGVALRDYPKITVTLQTEGGGPQSSGLLVLSGVIPG